MGFDFLYKFSETFLILRRNERDTITNVRRAWCNNLLFLSDFNENWIFSTDFRKMLKYQVLQNSLQWEPNCCMWKDGQTGTTKLIIAFSNFAKVPKIISIHETWKVFLINSMKQYQMFRTSLLNVPNTHCVCAASQSLIRLLGCSRVLCKAVTVCTCRGLWVIVFTLGAGLLARSQYSEGPATGHLDTVFSWFPCVYKQMLRWFPRFQVATTGFSCSPPHLNLLVTSFIFCIHVK